MTLQDLVDLSVAKSPLLTGGQVHGFDVRNFLWALSPENDGTPEGCERFTQTLPDLDLLYSEVKDYLRFVFLDSPKGEGSGAAVSSVACAIDFFASEYRWADHKTLATPLPQIFQLQRAATVRRGGKPSAQGVNIARAAWLSALNAVPPEHRERWKRDQSRALEKERKRGWI